MARRKFKEAVGDAVATEGEDLIDELLGKALQAIDAQVGADVKDEALKSLDERGGAQELVRNQYSGRYPFELLQNASDAMSGGPPGAVRFVLTGSALIVADQGSGFGEKEIRAVCSLGRSSKDLNMSIGYKGLGFKSVGEISKSPQVFSENRAFEFDEEKARAKVSAITGELPIGQRLPTYSFPFTIDPSAIGADREVVSGCMESGFTTVLRLPFRSGITRQMVEKHLLDVVHPRLLLFLDHVSKLTVVGTSSDFSAEAIRHTQGADERALLSIDGHDEQWRIFRDAISGFDRGLVESIGGPWQSVEEVTVAVAVEVDGQDRPLREHSRPLHVYFPTEDVTGLPIIVHGDFVLDLDRRHVSKAPESAKYNDWLCQRAASLVANVAHVLQIESVDRAAAVAGFAMMTQPSGAGVTVSKAITDELSDTCFVPLADGRVVKPMEARLLPEIPGQDPRLHGLFDRSRRRDLVDPAVDATPAARALVKCLGAQELSVAEALELFSEPEPEQDAEWYATLVSWIGGSGIRMGSHLGDVRCVRTRTGTWVKPCSGVFFPPQRDVADIGSDLDIPITDLPDLEGLQDLLQNAGVRQFVWREVIDVHVLPPLVRHGTGDEERSVALHRLRSYYETSVSVDSRLKARIGNVLLAARDHEGEHKSWIAAKNLYFPSEWTGRPNLERIYGPFGEIEFLDGPPPEDQDARRQEHDFMLWLGVCDHPRLDVAVASDSNEYLLTNGASHPHAKRHAPAWSSWRNSEQFKSLAKCPYGHPQSQQLQASYAIDRFTDLAESRNHDRLAMLWEELSNSWPDYAPYLQGALNCTHGMHKGKGVRIGPSLLDYMLRSYPWAPTSRDGVSELVCPSDVWRLAVDTPRSVGERVHRLDRRLEVAMNVSMVSSLGIVDAARPDESDLISLLRALKNDVDQSADHGFPPTLQNAARWSMRRLDRVAQSCGPGDEVPLLATFQKRHVFSSDPVTAIDPLLRETWSDAFPILDADKEMTQLPKLLRLRSLDDDVQVMPRVSGVLDTAGHKVTRAIECAKPFLAAAAIDHAPSREDEILRRLNRLEIVVCERLTLHYAFKGVTRERADAVSYVKAENVQEGSALRRIGTAYLEVKQETGGAYWYDVGNKLAAYMELNRLGDLFCSLLSGDGQTKREILSSKGINSAEIDNARAKLDQPLEDQVESSLLPDFLGTSNGVGLPDQRGNSGITDLVGSASPMAAANGGRMSNDSQRGNLGSFDDPEHQANAAPGDDLPPIDYSRVSMETAVAAPMVATEEAPSEDGLPRSHEASRNVDFTAQYHLNQVTGGRGEETVYMKERERLTELGMNPDLVVWHSKDHPTACYDIRSVTDHEQVMYIEVKATTGSNPDAAFDISANELTFAAAHRSSFWIYRVTDVNSDTPTITRYQDPIGRLADQSAALKLGGARMTFRSGQAGVVDSAERHEVSTR